MQFLMSTVCLKRDVVEIFNLKLKVVHDDFYDNILSGCMCIDVDVGKYARKTTLARSDCYAMPCAAPTTTRMRF